VGRPFFIPTELDPPGLIPHRLFRAWIQAVHARFKKMEIREAFESVGKKR
jgi:hypothetical protein